MHKLTHKILTLFQKRDILNLQQLAAILNMDELNIVENVLWLKKEEYIRCIEFDKEDLNPDSIGMLDQYQITLKGKAYLSECHRNKLNKFWSEFRAWMTLAISLAAFIRTFL